MATNKEESPEFFNFNGMNSPLNEEKEEIKGCRKMSIKLIIIISSIILSIILLIILFLIINKLGNKQKECESGYYLPDDQKSQCRKCSVDNCDKSSGTKESNICFSCIPNYFPFYENNLLKSCSACNEGCLTCDQKTKKCLKYNDGYKLENGICILNYSFKAIYYVDSLNKNVSLIFSNYKNKIKEVIIDGNIQTEINNAYNLKYGEHTVYILLDMNSLLDNMFYYCQDMKEIYFSSQFNNIEIKSLMGMFKDCK